MPTNKRDLLALRKEQADIVQDLNTKLDAIGDDAPTAEQLAEVRDLNKRLEDVSDGIKSAEELAGYRKTAGEHLRDMNAGGKGLPKTERELRDGEDRAQEKRDRQSATARVLADEQFKAWRESGAQGKSPRVIVPNVKGLITGASGTSAGAMVSPDVTGIMDDNGNREALTVLDLITVSATDSDTVEFVRENAFTNAGAEVAEATSTADGAKPESALTFTNVQLSVQNIAHWIPVTRRAVEDAGQLETYVRNLLVYGLRERLNKQILEGDGIAPNLQGVENDGGVQSQAFSTSLLETMRKARTLATKNGKRRPTAYVVDADTMEAVELSTDNNNAYYFGGAVTAYGINTVWGVPIVEDNTFTTANRAFVADWSLAFAWMRHDAVVHVSDSHSDLFVRNILTMLAEMRVAFGLIRPSAFVKIATA